VHEKHYFDIIKFAQNNMGVELEYFHSLHPKFKSYYNFTPPLRIKHHWFQLRNLKKKLNCHILKKIGLHTNFKFKAIFKINIVNFWMNLKKIMDS
jgi:hypothetical protein